MYGLGQPLPWPRYTTIEAPLTAAFTFDHVALGLNTLTTFDVYLSAVAAIWLP